MAWAISLTAMAAVIIANHQLFSQIDSNSSALIHGLHDGFGRVIWAIAMCYVIFACIHNMGGPINWFLSHPLWQPISKLSFAIYIVHHPIPLLMIGTMKTPPIMNATTFCCIALLNCIISIFVAIVGTLAFESPIIHLEKVFFRSPIVEIQKPNPINHVDGQEPSEKKII